MKHYSTYQSQFIEMFKDSPKSAISDFCKVEKGTTITRNEVIEGNIPVVAGGQEPSCYHNVANRKAGVITISASGAYSGFVNYWTTQIFASDCNTIIPIDEKNTNVHFLYHGLKAIQKEIYSLQKGGAQPHVYGKDIEKFLFPYPTKEEQDKFADIAQQADKSKFTSLKSQFIEMFDQVKNNKYGYKSYKLSECCSYISDGSHYSPKEDPNGQYPMLSVKDMTEKGFTYRDCKYINKEEYDKLVANGCKPEENDVLVAKDGSYFKYSFTILEEQEQAVLSSIAILRPNISIIDSKYLAYYLLTPEVIHMVEQNYLTGTAIKRVILKGFKELPVLVPPLDKQQEFVSILHQADKSKYIN